MDASVISQVRHIYGVEGLSQRQVAKILGISSMDTKVVSGTRVYGFIFILAYSRYLFMRFYPRYSLEFFLDGHIEAYKEIKGIAHRNRYDNLKSVVIQRRPELKFNPQFLYFALHYG